MLVDYDAIGQTAAVAPDSSWVIIAGVEDDMNRELAKSSLDSNNIPSLLLETGDVKNRKELAAMVNYHNLDLEQNLILVPKEYWKQAIYVLKSIFGIELEIDIKEHK